jgi:hypothetical protein
MTGGTLNIRIVFVRIDAPYPGTSARGIGEREMAPKTECPALVNNEFWRVRGMIDGGTMAVFTWDDSVRGFIDTVVIVGMAILAVFFPHIFYFELLPVFLVVLPMPAIHITTGTDTEVFRDIHYPGQQDQDNDADDHEQRPQNMILHTGSPSLNILYIKVSSHCVSFFAVL